MFKKKKDTNTYLATGSDGTPVFFGSRRKAEDFAERKGSGTIAIMKSKTGKKKYYKTS